MVRVIKKIVKGKEYLYLEHSIRIEGVIKKKTRYLGKIIPDNINEVIDQFYYDVFAEKWQNPLNQVRINYSKERNKMTSSTYEKYLNDFMVRFTYHTNRIEGSTLSLRETADLLDEGITPGNKPVNDVKEAETHKKVFFTMIGDNSDLSFDKVLLWHHSLFSNTKFDIAGSVRNTAVAISGSNFVPPPAIALDAFLDEFFDWCNKNKEEIHPVILAALVHVKFVSIHPFVDGNGRISRLMMNHVLHHNDYPMLFFQYHNRRGYYRSLERSQAKDQDYIFVQYVIRRYVKYYERYLKDK
jgi:Fic family protein